ncbi:hypothetical protein [Chryseobacterium sp. R2A-55]|uniref:hypothetical protein n=1 Tax=Chryseobacterium sp. R2A-55 TaxID=2744445 RepID=UPI001F25E4B8|nr:hypothetical protein [Chryseobacterium sp. R2A-55]
MKKLLTVLIFSFTLLLLTGCGGLKKEINRLTEESKTKTEAYEKEIAELNVKISETESRETKTKTDLEIKTSEISALKRERTQLQEELEKKERSDFSVENPNGPVKITDAKGNSYEFEGGSGTRISNSSESVLTSKLQTITELFSKESARSENLSKTVASQETSIKQKNTQITEQKEYIARISAQVKTLNEQLAKSILKTGLPPYVWVVAGMFLLALLQLLWKIYKPRKPIL